MTGINIRAAKTIALQCAMAQIDLLDAWADASDWLMRPFAGAHKATITRLLKAEVAKAKAEVLRTLEKNKSLARRQNAAVALCATAQGRAVHEKLNEYQGEVRLGTRKRNSKSLRRARARWNTMIDLYVS
jgi:hypothetical protein